MASKVNNILVTGANGFVGRQVISNFKKKDLNIKLVLRQGTKINKLAKEVDEVIFTNDMFKESEDWWKKTSKNIDTVIHIAWYAEPGKYLTSELNNDCYQGTKNMARGCANAQVKRFVGIGTCFEYEIQSVPVDIKTKLDPKTPYAKAKTDTYNFLTQFFQEKNIEFLWCRLFYLYGEGEDERRLVPYLRKNLSEGKRVNLSSGKKVKDYMNVQDAGREIVDLSLSKFTGPCNICSGEAITIRSFSEKIADEYGKKDLLSFEDEEVKSFDPPYIVGVKTKK